MTLETVRGARFGKYANALSDVINAALRQGMETDEAVCVAASVVADYARLEYGDAYLAELCKVVMSRAGAESPIDIGKHTS